MAMTVWEGVEIAEVAEVAALPAVQMIGVRVIRCVRTAKEVSIHQNSVEAATASALV